MCFKGNNMEYLTATSMLRVGGRWRNIHSEKSGERIKKRNISTCPSLFDFGGSPPWLKFLESFSRLVSFDLSSSYNKRTNGIAKSYTELRNLIYRHGNRVHTWFTTAFFFKIYHITSFEELRDSRSIKCFPAKNYELRFPASRFPVLGIRWTNDRLLSLPNDISHLQSILEQPESSSDACRFLPMDFKFQSE